jgi:hypothetical protein
MRSSLDVPSLPANSADVMEGPKLQLPLALVMKRIDVVVAIVGLLVALARGACATELVEAELVETDSAASIYPTMRGGVSRPSSAGGDDIRSIRFDAIHRTPRPVEELTAPQDIAPDPFPARRVDVAVTWIAPDLRHLPVYMEDVALERYGQTCHPLVQPAISGAKFYSQALTLPYRMGVDGPTKLGYDVGFARPGDDVPPVREHLPLSVRGTLYQGAAATGAVFLMHP